MKDHKYTMLLYRYRRIHYAVTDAQTRNVACWKYNCCKSILTKKESCDSYISIQEYIWLKGHSALYEKKKKKDLMSYQDFIHLHKLTVRINV
jgi:hypothetical protein